MNEWVCVCVCVCVCGQLCLTLCSPVACSPPGFSVQFSSVAQSCLLFAAPWTAAHQASLSVTSSWSLLKLMSIESMMPGSSVHGIFQARMLKWVAISFSRPVVSYSSELLSFSQIRFLKAVHSCTGKF